MTGMGEEGKVKYVVVDYGHLKNTHSCSHPEVEEKVFVGIIRRPQSVRPVCPAEGEGVFCEACEYYGNRKEFVSQEDGSVKKLFSGAMNDIPEES